MALTKISTAMISQSAAAVDLNVDAGTFYVDTTNNRVGVGGKTDPDTPLHVVGTATATLFAGSGASLTSIPNAALVNSSITINSTAVSLGGSLTLGTDDVAEGSSNLYYTDARVDARVSGGSLGNITTTGYIRGPATFTLDPAAHGDDTGTVVIAGNLQVDGTTTTINSTTMTVDDKNITLASGSANAAAADGAGFTVDIGTGTNPAITYDGTNDEWDFNKNINVDTVLTATGIVHDGDTDTSVKFLANRLYMDVGGNRVFDAQAGDVKINGPDGAAGIAIDTGGNVGIGTNTPDSKLDVEADEDTWISRIYNTGSDANAQGLLVRSDATAAHDAAVMGVYADGGYKMLVKSTGNVGIGTLPVTHYTGYEALDIGNTLSLMSNNTSTNISTLTNNGYLNSDASNWVRKVADESTMYEQVSGQHRFKTAASGSAGGAITWSEKMRIDASGNVGIGTTVTNTLHGSNYGTTKLHIDGGTDRGQIILEGDNSANFIMSDNGATANSRVFITQVNDGLLKFRSVNDNGTSKSDIMSLTSSGNVGIGTDSPGAKLSVETPATDATNNVHRVDLGIVSADNGYASGYAASGMRILGQANNSSGDDHTVFLEFNTRDPSLNGSHGTSGFITLTTPDSQGTYGTGQFDFYLRNSAPYTFPNDPAVTSPFWMPSLMTIKSSGNVGIGVIDPDTKLEVKGTSAAPSATAQILSVTNTTGGTRLDLGVAENSYGWIQAREGSTLRNLLLNSAGGNVGIGTDSPATILDVKNPGDSAYTGGLLIRTGTSTSEASSLYHDNNSATTTVLANRYDNAGAAIKLILRASSGSPVTALTALGNGNVGIGQTAFGVNGKLQVTGGISTTGNSEIRQSTNSDGSTLRFLGTQLVIANSNANGYSYSGGGLVASVSPSAGAITLDVGANNTSGHRLKVINGGDGIQGSLQYLSNTTARLNIDSATGAFTTTPAAGGHAVFNEGSIDADFRVESNDNTHMLFVDGGNNRVGIGKAPATHPLEVGVYAQFDTGMTINETGIDADFRVESNGNTHMLFVDGGNNQVGLDTCSSTMRL